MNLKLRRRKYALSLIENLPQVEFYEQHPCLGNRLNPKTGDATRIRRLLENKSGREGQSHYTLRSTNHLKTYTRNYPMVCTN